MRTDHDRDLAVEESCETELLRARFGVHIDDDDRRLFAETIDHAPTDSERIVDRRHKDATHQIHDTDSVLADGDRRDALTGRGLGVISRPQNALRALEIRKELPFIEGVVTAGQDVDTGAKELLRRACRQSESTGDILAVRNTAIDRILLTQQRHIPLDDVASGRADNITEQ